MKDKKYFRRYYTIDDIIWMGNQPTIEALADKCGVANTLPSAQLIEYLHKAQKAGRKIHYLPPYRDDNKIFLHNTLSIPFEQLKASASVEFIKGVVSLREIKEEEELKEMEKACNLGVAMHTAAMEYCKAGKLERDCRYDRRHCTCCERCFLSRDSLAKAKPYITNTTNTRKRSCYWSMRCELNRAYSSTTPVRFPYPEIHQKQKIFMKLFCKQMNIDMAKPGLNYFDVHIHATTIIAKGLTKLGLMKGNPEEAARKGAHALFMPHGLGHMLGLDVHDMEDLGENYVGYNEHIQRSPIFGHGSLRCAKKLQKGFILTVEPGIYFIPQLIDIWEKKINSVNTSINYDKVKPTRFWAA